MDPNVAIFAIFAVAILGGLARWLMGQRRPKSRFFRCARCSTSATHSERTIDAWRLGKTKFYCNSCHAEWLRSRPHPHSHPARPAGRARTGCLGAIILALLVPAVIAAVVNLK